MALARKAAPAAIKKLAELSKHEDPKVAMYASNAILDRAIGKPKQQSEHTGEDGGPIDITVTWRSGQ